MVGGGRRSILDGVWWRAVVVALVVELVVVDGAWSMVAVEAAAVVMAAGLVEILVCVCVMRVFDGFPHS